MEPRLHAGDGARKRRAPTTTLRSRMTTANSSEADGGVAADSGTAMVVGILFIVALVPFLIGGLLYGPSTGSADFLENAYPDRGLVTMGVLVELVAVLAIPLIGVFMFPVLRRYHEALALAYVAFRSLEALLLIAIEARLLSLIDLSDDHLNSMSSDPSQLQAMGDASLSANDQTFALYVCVFTVGAVIFYALLYRSRLIPRWLSTWGVAAAVVMLAGNLLFMFDTFSGTTGTVLEVVATLPIPLNEIVLAYWLIRRGFDSTANGADHERRATPSWSS